MALLHEPAVITDQGFLERQRFALQREKIAQEQGLAAILVEIDGGTQLDISRRGEQDDERPQRTIDRIHAESLVRRVRERIAAIESAIARLDDGSYGRCLSCERPIDQTRLEFLPDAALCAPCKSRAMSPLRRRS